MKCLFSYGQTDSYGLSIVYVRSNDFLVKFQKMTRKIKFWYFRWQLMVSILSWLICTVQIISMNEIILNVIFIFFEYFWTIFLTNINTFSEQEILTQVFILQWKSILKSFNARNKLEKRFIEFKLFNFSYSGIFDQSCIS